MTPRRSPQTIEQWLRLATHGLPGRIAQRACDELQSHFDDAVEDYQMQGKSTIESEQNALADLGDAGDTSKALRETHFARRWYVAGMIVGLVYPALLWLALIHVESTTPYVVGRPLSDVIILTPTFLILFVFGKFMALRTGDKGFHGPLIALVACLIISNVAIDVRLALFPDIGDSLWIVGAAPGQEWLWLAIGGLIGVGLGMLWLVVCLLNLRDTLYGLRIPLIAVGAVLAIAVLGFGIGLLRGELVFAFAADMLVMVMNLVMFALMALLFFRAAYRPSGRRVVAA